MAPFAYVPFINTRPLSVAQVHVAAAQPDQHAVAADRLQGAAAAVAGHGAQRGRETGAAERPGRAGLLPDRGPGHRHRPGPQVAVAQDRRQPDGADGLRRGLAVPGGRAAARHVPAPVPGVQGVRRAQRRPRPLPVAGRRAVRPGRRHRQRGADPVGRGHTRPRGVHRRDGQPGRGVRGTLLHISLRPSPWRRLTAVQSNNGSKTGPY